MKRLLILAGLAGAALAPAPVLAQNNAGVLVLYGNDKCPTDNSGNEIVVCQRRPEAERYRIPPQFRQETEIPANRESWSARAADAMTVGATGTNSCSSVGASGASGCLARDITKAKKEYRERRQEETDLPLP
jgi:hypothetical protein